MALELDRATRRRLEHVTATLAAEFDGVFSRQSVAGVVSDSLARLGDATVVQYLPLLCERFARQRLRAVAQADGLLAKTAPVLLFACDPAGQSLAIVRRIRQDIRQPRPRSAQGAPAVTTDRGRAGRFADTPLAAR